MTDLARDLELIDGDIASAERARARAMRSRDFDQLLYMKNELNRLRAKRERIVAGEPEPKYDGPTVELYPERKSI